MTVAYFDSWVHEKRQTLKDLTSLLPTHSDFITYLIDRLDKKALDAYENLSAKADVSIHSKKLTAGIQGAVADVANYYYPMTSVLHEIVANHLPADSEGTFEPDQLIVGDGKHPLIKNVRYHGAIRLWGANVWGEAKEAGDKWAVPAARYYYLSQNQALFADLADKIGDVGCKMKGPYMSNEGPRPQL